MLVVAKSWTRLNGMVKPSLSIGSCYVTTHLSQHENGTDTQHSSCRTSWLPFSLIRRLPDALGWPGKGQKHTLQVTWFGFLSCNLSLAFSPENFSFALHFQYGYKLPEDPAGAEVYCSVHFGMLGGRTFTYPLHAGGGSRSPPWCRVTVTLLCVQMEPLSSPLLFICTSFVFLSIFPFLFEGEFHNSISSLKVCATVQTARELG